MRSAFEHHILPETAHAQLGQREPATERSHQGGRLAAQDLGSDEDHHPVHLAGSEKAGEYLCASFHQQAGHSAFRERADEPNLDFANLVKSLKRRGKL